MLITSLPNTIKSQPTFYSTHQTSVLGTPLIDTVTFGNKQTSSPFGTNIYLGTGNPGKIQKFKTLGLNGPYTGITPEGVRNDIAAKANQAETGSSTLENARLKASVYHNHFKSQGKHVTVICEDFAFFQEHPDFKKYCGVHANRWLTPELYKQLFNEEIPTEKLTMYHRNKALVRLYDNAKIPAEDRKAYYESTFVIILPDGTSYHTQAKTPVQILAGNDAIEGLKRQKEEKGSTSNYITQSPSKGDVSPQLMIDLTPDQAKKLHAKGKAIVHLNTLLNKITQNDPTLTPDGNINELIK